MADRRLARLIDDGLLGDALALLADSRRQLSVPERVLKLELTSVTSAKDSCVKESTDLLSRKDLAGEDRVRCLIVSAIGQLRSGFDDSGCAAFRKAATHADKIGPEIACYARIWQLGALASWIGPEAASLEIASTRQLVTAAGRPDFTVRFHLSLAEIAAKQGLLQRARRHLEVAADLLTSYPNKYLQAEIGRAHV